MVVDGSRRWVAATLTIIAVWVALAVQLMVADVWDETNGMLAFSSPAQSLTEKLHFVLTRSLGFWRPLPTLLVTVVLHFVRDFDTSWRVLRSINMLLLLSSLWLMLRAIDTPETKVSPQLRIAFTFAFLFSGSAFITAGWYANVFDASALFLISLATLLLLRNRPVVSGLVFGVAFFCKETSALAFPFLVMLLAAQRTTFRNAVRAGIPAAALGTLYFAIRSRIVSFGGPGDVHGFVPEQLWPTVFHLAESFWRQTLEGAGPGIAGYVILAMSLAALRRPRLVAAAVAFLCSTAVVYWGMFGEYQNGILIHHLNFVGRLFLVPVALMLLTLALERRVLTIALLCLPIGYGALTTWRDHARFQQTYRRVYRAAAESHTKPLVVHYPPKPLADDVRGILIGDHPGPTLRIDSKTGRLLPGQ